MDDRHRLDVWLKRVCLFKHRGDATEACRGGHVKLNGQRVKPASVVREGDVVEFFQGERPRRVVVAGLPAATVSKETARTLYTDESPAWQPVDRVTAILRERGAGRPTKKERRELDRIKR